MSKAIAEETMPKKEFQAVQLQSIGNTGGMKLALTNFAELEKFSHLMALSNFVPKHLRGKQADCLAVLLQSMRWEMDPFAVAQKTYFVNDGMGYEAQLVNAVIISKAPLKQRPKFAWSGAGEDLKCSVSATFKGEEEVCEFEAKIRTITTRNSPLWKQQPEQQLAYFALRAWARLYAPDIIMGVYTKEERQEMTDNIGADNAINVTPQTSAINEILQQQTPHNPETGEIIEGTTTEQSSPVDQFREATEKVDHFADANNMVADGDNSSPNETVTESNQLLPLESVPVGTKRTGAELKAAFKHIMAHLAQTPPDAREMLIDMYDPGLADALGVAGMGGDKRKLLEAVGV